MKQRWTIICWSNYSHYNSELVSNFSGISWREQVALLWDDVFTRPTCLVEFIKTPLHREIHCSTLTRYPDSKAASLFSNTLIHCGKAANTNAMVFGLILPSLWLTTLNGSKLTIIPPIVFFGLILPGLWSTKLKGNKLTIIPPIMFTISPRFLCRLTAFMDLL